MPKSTPERNYDPSKDEVVQKFGKFVTEESRGIVVRAMSYDGGPIRIGIFHYVKTEEGTKYYAARRLNGKEIPLVIKGLKRAMTWFDENKKPKKK